MIKILKRGDTVYLAGRYEGNGIYVGDNGPLAWRNQRVIKGKIKDFYGIASLFDNKPSKEAVDISNVSKKDLDLITVEVTYDEPDISVFHWTFECTSPVSVYRTYKHASEVLRNSLDRLSVSIAANVRTVDAEYTKYCDKK